MGHAYTPGLTVTERTTVRKRRLLPIPGTVTAKQGDQLKADSVVAHAELPGKVHSVNVANLLGIAPDETRDYLTKKEGEPVEKDDVIAENKPFIQFLKTVVRSPIRGTVETASTVTGQVLLREPPRHLELLAYIDGTVAEVHAQQGITIETPCTLVQGIFGVGGETWGEIQMAVASPDEILAADRLTADMKGKIVVGGSFLGADTLGRAREIGVAALIVGGIHDKDLRALLGYDLGVAITGTEKIGITVILTEGFGTIPMAAKTFALLSKYQGRKASVSGATQIRAGVIRPEIIIPSGVAHQQTHDTVSSERGGIQVGDQVRVIRDPLFGRIGQVAALPANLQQIETESHVRVLEVSFPDKTRAVIPRANVEIIEG
jgi:predicted transcriptional regulator